MSDFWAFCRKGLSLQGRCSRKSYAVYVAAVLLILAIPLLIWSLFGVPLTTMLAVFLVALIAPNVAISVRRLHDIGLSGWFFLVYAIPVVGAVFSWLVTFKRGQVGPNRYGDEDGAPARQKPSRPFREWTTAGLASAALGLSLACIRIFIFEPFSTSSAAMEPTLRPGDYVIVSKLAYGYSKHTLPLSLPLPDGRIWSQAPHRGDVVVFKLPSHPKTSYMKRLIGLPGDRIQLRGGVIYINGGAVARKLAGVETATCPGAPGTQGVAKYRETLADGRSFQVDSCLGDTSAAQNTGEFVVPRNCYFMLGDNLDNSIDSRFGPAGKGQEGSSAACPWDSATDIAAISLPGVGFVPEENLIGRAVLAVTLTGKPNPRWF